LENNENGVEVLKGGPGNVGSYRSRSSEEAKQGTWGRACRVYA
jgi:hypothetical protein